MRSRASGGRSHMSSGRSGSVGRSHVSSSSRSTISMRVGSSRHHHSHHGGHWHHHHHHGGVGVFVSPSTMLLIIGIFFSIMFAIIFWASVNNSKAILQEMQTDYMYYQNVISYAEKYPEYQKVGEITGIYKHNEYNKYYMTYRVYVEDDGTTKTVDESTFYVYDEDVIAQFQVGDDILIACDSYDVQNTVDMDYKNFSLEEDGEYAYYLKKSQNTKAIFISIAVGVIFVVIFVIVKVRRRKKAEAQEEVEKKVQDASANKCKYCGAKLSSGSSKCGECGASRVE